MESLEDLQMMRKCHVYICLHLVLGITIHVISKINCSRNQAFNSLVNLSTLLQPFSKQVSSIQGCIRKKLKNQRGKVHTHASRSFASPNKYNTSLSQTQNHIYQLQNGNIIPTLQYISQQMHSNLNQKNIERQLYHTLERFLDVISHIGNPTQVLLSFNKQQKHATLGRSYI